MLDRIVPSNQATQSVKGELNPLPPPVAVIYRPVRDLVPDPRNPRTHTVKQVRQIAKSIEAFEFNVPILVDRNGKVIAGHGRLLACKELGWAEVPTITLEHLSAAQTRAFLIADNRLTEVAGWNDALLAEQLKELSRLELNFKLDVTGFEMGEIDLRIEERQWGSLFGMHLCPIKKEVVIECVDEPVAQLSPPSSPI